jgi:hypothetical protein
MKPLRIGKVAGKVLLYQYRSDLSCLPKAVICHCGIASNFFDPTSYVLAFSCQLRTYGARKHSKETREHGWLICETPWIEFHNSHVGINFQIAAQQIQHGRLAITPWSMDPEN